MEQKNKAVLIFGPPNSGKRFIADKISKNYPGPFLVVTPKNVIDIELHETTSGIIFDHYKGFKFDIDSFAYWITEGVKIVGLNAKRNEKKKIKFILIVECTKESKALEYIKNLGASVQRRFSFINCFDHEANQLTIV